MRKIYRKLFKRRKRRGVDVINVKLSKKNLKRYLLEVYDYKCCYCGQDIIEYKPVKGEIPPLNMATVDHILPESKGGKRTLNNCCICCLRCNNLLGDSLDTFKAKKRYILNYLKYDKDRFHVVTKWEKDITVWEKEQRKRDIKRLRRVKY